MTAVAAALRWAHLLFAFLLVGSFGLTLLAGRATHLVLAPIAGRTPTCLTCS